MNSKTAFILVIPGSVSLFVLLNFLQDVGLSDSNLSISNFSFLLWGPSPTADQETMAAFVDAQNQLNLFLSTTIALLAPPVVWLFINVFRDAKARRELRVEGDETST